MTEEEKKERNRRYQREWRARQPKDKLKELDRKKYLKNKIKKVEQNAEWCRRNPHRTQASGHQQSIKRRYPEKFIAANIYTWQLAKWLKPKRGGECPYCGTEAYHLSHIQPLDKGGEYSLDNMEVICYNCSKLKDELTREEFYSYINSIRVKKLE